MRQSITTKYMGPTNSKGSRIKAIARKADQWGKEMSITIPLDYSLSTEDAHTKAAKACAEKYGWPGLWIGGGNVDENGYVYTCLGELPYPSALADSVEGREDRDWFYMPKREAI